MGNAAPDSGVFVGTAVAVAAALTDITVLVDRSGSMQTIKDDMEGAFNAFVQSQREVPGECLMTLGQFDDQSIETVYAERPVRDVPKFKLEPRGGTPLLDAIGKSVSAKVARMGKMAKKPDKIIMVVITDGQENSSHEWRLDQIKSLIQEKTKEGWVFIYLGADSDAFKDGTSMGFDGSNVLHYAKNAMGTRGMSASLASNVRGTRLNTNSGKFTEQDYAVQNDAGAAYADGTLVKDTLPATPTVGGTAAPDITK